MTLRDPRESGLPNDVEVLDRARHHLSEARDWLNSDTLEAIAGNRSRATVDAIHEVMRLVGEAKGEIDGAKGALDRERRAIARATR